MKKLLTAILLSAFGQITLTAQNLYDTDQITTIEITFQESNWNQVLNDLYAAGNNGRLLADVEINGVSFDSVGIRYRGGSTYDSGNAKNPLNIKLDHVKNQDFQGTEVLKLSNGAKDPSWLREVMGFEILRNYMEAPRANYASVYVNGNFLGVYANVESINSKFFEERFLSNPDNPRFECDPSYDFDEVPPPPFGCVEGHGAALEFLGVNDLCFFPHYDIQSPTGWSDLREMTLELSNDPDEQIWDFLDVDRFIWMSTFNSLTANLDSYFGPSPRNYFLFRADHGTWLPVVDDLNECFARFPWATIPEPGDPQPSLNFYTELDPFLGEDDDQKPLLKAIFANGTSKRMYVAHMRTMMEEQITSGWFEQRAMDLQSLITDEVASDANHFYTHAEFLENLDGTVVDSYDGEDAYGLYPLLDERTFFLQNLPEFQATPPSISNVSASPNMPTVGTPVNVTAAATGADLVVIGFRKNRTERFEFAEMLDDGMNGDGAAGDGIYGATLTAEVGGFQYYVYAENAQAGMFSPERAEFEFYSLSTSGEVVINEIMARNQTTVADQDDEYDDWVEIFNNTTNTVNLEGWFLSDDLANPQKWPFPAGVFLDPGQYLTVWCDDDEQQAGLHTSFNLNGDGEEILLVMPDGTVADQVIFGNQITDVSIGRCPDGTGSFISLPPTFGTDNTPACLNPTSELAEALDLKVFPNPASNWVRIEASIERPLSANLVSPFGQTMMEFQLGNVVDLSLEHLPNGIYFLEAEGQFLEKIVVAR